MFLRFNFLAFSSSDSALKNRTQTVQKYHQRLFETSCKSPFFFSTDFNRNLLDNFSKMFLNPTFTPLFQSLCPLHSDSSLTHVDEQGKASMVDVSKKPITERNAVATARVWLSDDAFGAVQKNAVKKGDVLAVAKIAGIMAAKRCSGLIPLCHDLALTNVEVSLQLNHELQTVDIEASASTCDRTGVEMESLTAASVAALTVYDMCKAISRESVIGDIKLQRKSGGASGDYDVADK